MKWLKVGTVVVTAVVVTALGIDASDTLSGKGGTLLGQLVSSSKISTCPVGMVHVAAAQTFTCVDLYEASVGDECPIQSPNNEIETKQNIDTPSCSAESKKEVAPWRYITREQASVACLRSGKRLPKSSEWNLFSVGTPDTTPVCNTSSDTHKVTGVVKECVSAVGAFDAVGNVWEWTTGDIIDGVYQGRIVPEEGYVAQVDADGMATLTDKTKPSPLFYDDYFWSASQGSFGILRGGFYGSQSDAGVYAIQARTLPTAAGTAIGFRCVK